MADYYDRLEAQLADATERGVPSRRFAPRLAVHRWASDVVAVSLALGAVVAVVVLVLGLGSRHRAPEHVGTPGVGLAMIRNYAPGKVPALSGQMVCDATLQPPGGGKSPRGTAVVNTRPPTRYVFSITASGLEPNFNGSVYAVWLRPAVRTTSGSYELIQSDRPEFIGLISPPVNRDGRLAAEGLLPQAASGAYQVLITLEPGPSAKTPGQTVLQGDINF